MNDITIRHTALPDIPYLYEICLKTGDAGKDASALFYDPYLIGQYYAAPYLIYPEGICFVAEYKHRPQGYILAAPDTLAFYQWLEEIWLPPLRKQYPRPFTHEILRSKKEEKILETIHRSHVSADEKELCLIKDYPAHLHIDMLPAIQGKGMGRALMNTLCKELAQQHIPGVHLGVANNNPNAIAFYRKTGFSVYSEEEWGYVMTLITQQ